MESSSTVEVRELQAGDGNSFIVVPGILARCDEQFAPLLPALNGEVIGFHDTGPFMLMGDNIRVAVSMLRERKARQVPTTLVGASMGGMKIPFFVEAYRNEAPDDDLSWLRCVVIDAPTGAATMKEVPGFAAGILASSLAGLVLSSSIGDWAVGKMTVPPKDDEITTPSDAVMRQLTGCKMDESDWRKFVKDTAMSGLTGYSGSLWHSWLQWMINVGRDGSLAESCKSLEGVNTTYLSCIHPGNGVIAQPAAADWWADHVPGLRLAKVHGTHCGFLQNQQQFDEVFQDILAGG